MRKLIASMLLVGLLTSPAAARIWNDATGKFQIEAEYQGINNGTVFLRMKNGETKTVAFNRLSKEDQDFIKSQPANTSKLLGNKPAVKATDAPDFSGKDRFSQAIAKNPRNAQAYVVRGMARTNGGEFQDAIDDFNYALTLDAKNPTAYTGRGRAYAKSGDAAQAHRDYNKAIEIDNKYGPAYKYRADNMPAYFKTEAGKARLKEFSEKAREKRDRIDKKYLQKFPWQPPNSTTDEGMSQAAIQNLANLDYAMFRQLEAKYGDDWGYGGLGLGGGGYGGVGVGGVAVGGVVAPGVVIGDTLKLDGVVSVYPQTVLQGEEVTIIANPGLLEKGMPQLIDPNAPRPKRGQKPATIPQDITSVDFYADSNRDGKLQKDQDTYLATDSYGQDGFSTTVKTTGYLPGNQAYFAVPKGSGESGGEGSANVVLTLNENVLRAAAKTERNIARKAAEAANGEGLSADAADALGKEQAELARLVSDVKRKIQKSAPEVAKSLSETRKPIGQAVGQLRQAKKDAGANSKVPANNASQQAEMAADQLEAAANALAKLTGSGGDKTDGEQGDGQPGDGQPGDGQGDAKPTKPPTDEKYAGAPGIGAGKIELAKGGPGKGDGDGDGDGGNGGDGDDDDDTVVNNYYGDRVDVDVDDDDRRFGLGVDRDDVVDLADRYYRDGDYDRAIEKYDLLVRDQPYNVGYVRDRARTYYDAGNYDLAIRDYDRIAKVAKPGYDFYYNRGCAYLAAGKYDEAISDFTMSVRLDELGELGNLPYNNRGITYARKGDYEQALSDFNKAIEVNKNDRLAYRNRALAYKKLGQLEQAQLDLATFQKMSGQ